MEFGGGVREVFRKETSWEQRYRGESMHKSMGSGLSLPAMVGQIRKRKIEKLSAVKA
jgi:hypothetical protein